MRVKLTTNSPKIIQRWRRICGDRGTSWRKTLARFFWNFGHEPCAVCRGLSGVGKSWLASALANKACCDNRSVLYQRVPRLFADLALARGDGAWIAITLRCVCVRKLPPSRPCLHRIEQVICWGLGMFESQGLFERDLPNRQLADGFESLVAFARHGSTGALHPPSTVSALD